MTSNDDPGKLFIGGLSWETSKEVLHDYFSQFGDVVDSVVMKNNETGRSRGFGFVTYSDPNCVSAVLKAKPHELNGRIIDAKECTPRNMQKVKSGGGGAPGKVFLGGLPPDVLESDIRACLSCFGTITQITIMCDPETKKCRGFGFLSFESEDSIEQACALRYVNVNGKQVECKRAEPKENRRNFGQQHYNSQNGGMRQSSYGGNGNAYQAGWNSHQQYSMQGYAGYSSYSPVTGNTYQAGSMSYNDASQFQPPTYSTYATTGYGYAQVAPGAYSQAVVADPYSQSASAYPPPLAIPIEGKASNVADTSYGSAGGRGQGYHPYRR